MKQLHPSSIIIFIGIVLIFSNCAESQDFSGKTIQLESTDNILINTDIYETDNESDPVILLFHQAGYSRGEYRAIAPKLNELGFTCIAIDQRSGKEVNGIRNEAFMQAKKLNLPSHYRDAVPDLKALIDYALETYPTRKVIIWGSSYSAALSFVLGAEYQEKISGIIAFSPGEYFTWKDKKISDYATEIQLPVFLTSSGKEKDLCTPIYEAIPSIDKTYYLPDFEGQHGSKALWEKNDGHEKYWVELIKFLDKF